MHATSKRTFEIEEVKVVLCCVVKSEHWPVELGVEVVFEAFLLVIRAQALEHGQHHKELC